MGAFGDALKQLLTERNLSGNEVARRIGVTGTTISYWIAGKTQPTRDNVVRLEDELAVEPRGSLLALAGYSVVDPGTPTVESLIRADPELDPEDKRVLLRILRMARERYTQALQSLL